jgi:putative ABC transport system ATP-binding protein
MLSLKKVGMIFHPGTVNEKRVIEDLDLQVDQGDFITIIGSNGAGKSTLFNLTAGTHQPTAGQIFFKGRDITREPEYRRAAYMGRIFQNPLLGTASNMTLEDNMMITCNKGFKWPVISLNKKMRQRFHKEVRQLDMGLESRMKENVSSLSGGQRQALTLLMTVLSSPDILLLDEHTAALDPRNAAMVMDLTRRFITEKKLTSLMITHNMGHAIEFGNRLIMMDGGEIIIDVKGETKKALTIKKLIDMFGSIRKKTFENDEVLLTN